MNTAFPWPGNAREGFPEAFQCNLEQSDAVEVGWERKGKDTGMPVQRTAFGGIGLAKAVKLEALLGRTEGGLWPLSEFSGSCAPICSFKSSRKGGRREEMMMSLSPANLGHGPNQAFPDPQGNLP